MPDRLAHESHIFGNQAWHHIIDTKLIEPVAVGRITSWPQLGQRLMGLLHHFRTDRFLVSLPIRRIPETVGNVFARDRVVIAPQRNASIERADFSRPRSRQRSILSVQPSTWHRHA